MSTTSSASATSTTAAGRFAMHGFPALRRLLVLDAATCAAMGAGLLVAAAPVAAATALPEPLLLHAGAMLVPIAAFMAAVGLRSRIWVSGVALIVAGNAVWAGASIAIVVAGLVAPNVIGSGLLLGQALAVAILAALEYRALRPVLARRADRPLLRL